MIRGLSVTDRGTLLDAKAARAAGYEFGYLCVQKTVEGGAAGGKNDQNASGNREKFTAAGMPFGVFADFDWRPGATGKAQADELANFCRADDVLPPGIRLWEISGASISNWTAFTVLLAEMVYYLDNRVHRRPVIMANEGQIRAITNVMMGASASQDLKTWLSSCWWDVISWKDTVPVLPAPWTKFPFHEYTNHVSAVPGALGVALIRWPGNLVQLQTWCKNPTLDNLPAWGDVVQPPPEAEDPVEEEPEEVKLADVHSLLKRLSEHLGLKP